MLLLWHILIVYSFRNEGDYRNVGFFAERDQPRLGVVLISSLVISVAATTIICEFRCSWRQSNRSNFAPGNSLDLLDLLFIKEIEREHLRIGSCFMQ